MIYSGSGSCFPGHSRSGSYPKTKQSKQLTNFKRMLLHRTAERLKVQIYHKYTDFYIKKVGSGSGTVFWDLELIFLDPELFFGSGSDLAGKFRSR